MAILEKEVWVILNNRTVNHYEEKGYNIPRRKDSFGRVRMKKGTEILVKIDDLTPRSFIRLTKICDECGKVIPDQPYSKIVTRRLATDEKKDRCFECGNIASHKKRKNNVPYERSLEYYAKYNNMQHLITEFSIKNNIETAAIYKSSSDSYIWECPRCKSEYEMKVHSRTGDDNNCPYCAGYRINHTNSLNNINAQIAKEWHPTKNGKLTADDVGIGCRKKIWWKCEDGHEWKATVNSRVSGTNCPTCKHSKGEKRILNWLNENKVTHVSQKRFKDLLGLGNRNLSYDFYLTEQNLLIEYQGEYHDGTARNQTEEQFRVQQEHDRRKHNYAKQNNIDILEIWYYDFNRIEEILSNTLLHK